MGKKAQKKDSGAPRRLPPPRWVDPHFSDEEMDWCAMRALVTRVEALEKECDEFAAGRGDGESSFSAPEPPPFLPLTRPGRGANMFRVLLSRVTSLEFSGNCKGNKDASNSEVQTV